ncbi:MAG TPA: FAD-binding oxidoreductase [Vicinamibacterales bacterium]
MNAIGATAFLSALRRNLSAIGSFRRRRPSDVGWPSSSAWRQLNDAVGGNLLPVSFPLSPLKTNSAGSAVTRLFQNLKNPYFIGDEPGLTQTLGWVDAWTTQPSAYAVAARNAHDIARAVDFARDNELRLVVKGGGHSYQGTSNAPDSLLIWTRHMNDIAMHAAFVPKGCEGTVPPQPAVTLGAGTIWRQAYDAVTTHGGKYVQGGGCLTVGVPGLIQSGGFGSFSKHYGLAAGGLLEAEVVTADGQIRIANACTNSDLFWALKGGGGGSYGVISRVTLRLHDLPEFFGAASFTIKARSDADYRRLLREFVTFYHDHLFNDHWGEQVAVTPDNSLVVNMVSHGLATEQARSVWQPFLDRVASVGSALDGRAIIASVPARRFWDLQWWSEHWPELVFPNPDGSRLLALLDGALRHVRRQPLFEIDGRPGVEPNRTWFAGDGGQVGWFIWGFDSVWLPASLLESDGRQRLADALFESSRHSRVELHFNKGLAGATPDAIARARDTAMNPAVVSAFALAMAAASEQPVYPGIRGHEPSVDAGRTAAQHIERCMQALRAVAGQTGSYVSESNYFERHWQEAYWGSNYARLAEIKRKYDPTGLFVVHNGVGSEQWSADGFTRL